MMEIIPYGESALLVNFEQRIDPIINASLHRLRKNILALPAELGITFALPSYCSLLIGFKGGKALAEKIIVALSSLKEEQLPTTLSRSIQWKIPVCFETDFGPDLSEVCAEEKRSQDELLRLLTTADLRVYACGFIPGFAYLGTTGLDVSRRSEPRKIVPAGSIGLAGSQTGIYPCDSPGGWKIVGQTPLRVLRKERKIPYLFSPGDELRFYSISREEFDALKIIENSGKLDPYTFRNEI